MNNNRHQPASARPHLIHIGYAKSGSSFLRRWFAEHPEIAYRPNRFAGIGGFEDLAGEVSDTRLRVTSSETLASPVIAPEHLQPGGYSAAQANICGALAELFPEAHILIVTRGFRSMIMSSYSQFVRSGGTKSLEELVRDAGNENPWDYDMLVGMYRRRFGAEKVMVLPWEALRDTPKDFLRRIEARFGLTHRPVPPQRVNPSLTPHEMRWYPRIARALAKAPLGTRLRSRLQKRLAQLSHRNRLAPAVRLLQRVAPAPPVSLELLTPATLEAFRGRARSLAAEPLFSPYASDYLNDA